MDEIQFNEALKDYLDNHKDWNDESFIQFYKQIEYYANCQLEMFCEALDQAIDESMDGDFDSAMASAGLGMDEDYGYYGGND